MRVCMGNVPDVIGVAGRKPQLPELRLDRWSGPLGILPGVAEEDVGEKLEGEMKVFMPPSRFHGLQKESKFEDGAQLPPRNLLQV